MGSSVVSDLPLDKVKPSLAVVAIATLVFAAVKNIAKSMPKLTMPQLEAVSKLTQVR